MDHSGVREIQAQLAESIKQYIGSTKTLTPAVLLLMHFSDTALAHFSPENMMGRLVAQGQSRLAEEWAQSLGHSFQVLLFSGLHLASLSWVDDDAISCIYNRIFVWHLRISGLRQLQSHLLQCCMLWQVKLVEECVAMEKVGQACKTTRHFSLQKEFPTIERDYQEHVLARLIDRQQWQAALTVCDDDKTLQVG